MTIPDANFLVIQQMANNQSEIDSLREENNLFKQEISKLTMMLTQIMSNFGLDNGATLAHKICPTTHDQPTTTSQEPTNTTKTVTIQKPAKIQEPAKTKTSKSINIKKQENRNCFQKKTSTTTQDNRHNTNQYNKMISNTNDFSYTATLVCGFIPTVQQSNNFVKHITVSHTVNVWFPNEKPNVIQFKFENQQDMEEGIQTLNSIQGNQWASPINIPNFKTGAKGYGEDTNINNVCNKLAKVISVIKSKKLSPQISFTKTKDNSPKFKIIVIDDKESNIEILESETFASIKLNKGIPKDSVEYNLTCLITFTHSTPQDVCLKTIKELFQDAHVQFKDECLTYNENQSKYKEGEKYHHYSYICENESEATSLSKASIVILSANRKLNKRFRRYSEAKKNPYPTIQHTNPTSFNFSVTPLSNSNDNISALSSRISKTEEDIQEIRKDNNEIKMSLSALNDMMKELLQNSKSNKQTTAGKGSIGGSMDTNND